MSTKRDVYTCLIEHGPHEPHVQSLVSAVGSGLAVVTGGEFRGEVSVPNSRSGRSLLVPTDTLLPDDARALGVHGPDDFFGGHVPSRLMKTKVIVHPLTGDSADRPAEWQGDIAGAARMATLPGYSVFSVRDAKTAANLLRPLGDIRLKDPLGASGRGQVVTSSEYDLDCELDKIPRRKLESDGLVLELDLASLTTFNVGRIAVAGFLLAYFGIQRMTRNNDGELEYGGSTLYCVRGGWDCLYKLGMPADLTEVVSKVRAFDDASDLCPGFMASRRNYDAALGYTRLGTKMSGVLEASWRAGAASTAEVAALLEFARNPSVQFVVASAVKEFGEKASCPPGAVVHYRGDDPANGPMLRYTLTRKVACQIPPCLTPDEQGN
jgi:hypothetical protein